MNIDVGQNVSRLNRTRCEETEFDELQPGDRIKVEYGEVLEAEDKRLDVIGTVLRTEHHPRRLPNAYPDCRPGDLILLETPTGELLVITVGRATVVRRA